jgi:hypothetical protein
LIFYFKTDELYAIKPCRVAPSWGGLVQILKWGNKVKLLFFFVIEVHRILQREGERGYVKLNNFWFIL